MYMYVYCRIFRVSLDMLSVQAETGPPWENKTEQAFWRGRDSRQERLDLVRMSQRHPDVIDARLTHMFFFKHSDDLGEIVKRVPFFDFFQVIQKPIYCFTLFYIYMCMSSYMSIICFEHM